MKVLVLAIGFSLLASGCSSCEKTNSGAPSPAPTTSTAMSVQSGPDPECEKLCRINGRCKARDGKCYAYREIDCVQCGGCRALGLCTLKNEVCVAEKAEDCRKASICETSQQCTPRDGKCVKAE